MKSHRYRWLRWLTVPWLLLPISTGLLWWLLTWYYTPRPSFYFQMHDPVGDTTAKTYAFNPPEPTIPNPLHNIYGGHHRYVIVNRITRPLNQPDTTQFQVIDIDQRQCSRWFTRQAEPCRTIILPNGHLRCLDHRGHTLFAYQYDPFTGTRTDLGEWRFSEYETTPAGDLLVLAHAGPDQPFAFQSIDLTTGQTRHWLRFPDRQGDIQGQVSSCQSWTISPDGKYLALAEAWDHDRRLSPAGVEVYELSTGRLMMHLCEYPAPPAKGDPSDRLSSDIGATQLQFLSDRHLSYHLQHRVSSSQNAQSWFMFFEADHDDLCWDITTGLPALTREHLTGTHSSVNHPYPIICSGDQRYQLWIESFPRWKPKTVRLQTHDGTPRTPWRTIPPEVATIHQDDVPALPASDGTGVLFWHNNNRALPEPLDKWLMQYTRRGRDWLADWYTRQQAQFLWWDTNRDDLYAFHSHLADSSNQERYHVDTALQPGRAITLLYDQHLRELQIAVWPTPPPRPLSWSWRAGLSLSFGILCCLLRRRWLKQRNTELPNRTATAARS